MPSQTIRYQEHKLTTFVKQQVSVLERHINQDFSQMTVILDKLLQKLITESLIIPNSTRAKVNSQPSRRVDVSL